MLPYKLFLYLRSDDGGVGMIFLLLHVVTNSLSRSKRNADWFRHRHPTAGNGSCKFGIFFIFIFCLHHFQHLCLGVLTFSCSDTNPSPEPQLRNKLVDHHPRHHIQPHTTETRGIGYKCLALGMAGTTLSCL